MNSRQHYAGQETSNDITNVEEAIQFYINDTNESVSAMPLSHSLLEYRQYSARIIENKNILYRLLDRFIVLERTNGFPINLKYRDWHKRLGKIK